MLVLGIGMTRISIADIEISNKTPTSHIDRVLAELTAQHDRATYDVIQSRLPENIEARKKEQERIQEQSRIREEEKAKKIDPRIGMTTNQILHNSKWGKPYSINTTIDASGKYEQWIYGNGKYLYFKNGKLTSIQY